MTGHGDHDGKIIDQFTRWARPFAELPVHAEAAAMAQTLAACATASDLLVLDVACGPGILACALAERSRHVTGIDLTPAMIAQAHERQAALALENLDWHVGNAAALPFENGRFDRVVTRYAFHHMPDPAAVLAEMTRVCRPGGRIVVVDSAPSTQTQGAFDRMERLRDPSHASALTCDQLRQLGRAAGLTERLVDGYRLEARLADLADETDMDALSALLEADIREGLDRCGVAPRRTPDGLTIYFPISIVAWQA